MVRAEIETAFAGIGSDGLIAQGLANVLIVKPSLVQRLNLGGAVALGSGVLSDLRWSELKVYEGVPSAQSEHARLSVISANGDALSRLNMGIERIRFSVVLAFEFLEQLKKFPSVDFPDHRTDLSRIEWKDIPAKKEFSYAVEACSGPIQATVSQAGVVFSTNSTKLKSSMESILIGVHREDLDVAFASLGFDSSQGDLV
ncbi:MAG: hypothetical protein K2X47_18850 [Bdellovibrionales bacterium]|nr:hypothetical protein [Bdellovibrionales bacterium]